MKLILLLLATLLAACTEATPPPSHRWMTDQCLRAELFKACLTTLPKGPERVVNSNDWDEVVGKCDTVSYYQSRRQAEHIKPECRGS